MKANVTGVWSIDDAVTIVAPSLSLIAEMLRVSAARGDLIELRRTALNVAELLTTKAPVQMDCTNTVFRDEIGC
jgi:hypothetical protein